MKAFPALRLLACASLFSFVGVTTSSAQLYYHVVDLDSAPGVDSGNNLGVAIDATFTFSINAGVGTLQLKLKNLAGTAKASYGEGAGNYTGGILTGFGFDGPMGATYIAGSFAQALSASSLLEPGGIDFVPTIPYTETNPVGNFDFGAASSAPAPHNGLAGGYEAVFTFKFNGDLTYFTPGGFFSHNGTDADFGFRFQSIPVGEGSDKFVYYVDDNPPIPEPSTYGLLGAGILIAIVGRKRVRGRK
jgi:PEP-CTERM motif